MNMTATRMKTTATVNRLFAAMLFLSALLFCATGYSEGDGGYESPEALAKAFQNAMQNQDLNAAMALYNLEGVGAEDRQMIEATLKEFIKGAPANCEKFVIAPLPDDFRSESEYNGMMIRQNCKPTNKVYFSSNGQGGRRMGMLIGTLKDRYFFPGITRSTSGSVPPAPANVKAASAPAPAPAAKAAAVAAKPAPTQEDHQLNINVTGTSNPLPPEFKIEYSYFCSGNLITKNKKGKGSASYGFTGQKVTNVRVTKTDSGKGTYSVQIKDGDTVIFKSQETREPVIYQAE